jgi:antirestriction protein ArdC
MEELRAELASAFVALKDPQDASYIADSLRPLKHDKREIFRAGADAQRVVDIVLGFHPDFAVRPALTPHLVVDP